MNPDNPSIQQSTTPQSTPVDLAGLETTLGEIRGGWAKIKDLPDTVRTLTDNQARFEDQLQTLRRSSLLTPQYRGPRAPGQVSQGLAAAFGSRFVLHYASTGRLEAVSSLSSTRDLLLNEARNHLRLTTRAALTTSDIPLPDEYAGEFRDLITEYGVARRYMSPYPIGLGTARPARMGTRPAFGPIAMSGAFPEKSPTLTFASLESHKIGGIVKVPRELEEQSIVPIGRFLARYGATEFAREEDLIAFLADGSGTFENIKGIVTTASENGTSMALASTKTHPSDATLDDLRALRRLVNKAVLSARKSAYLMDRTWESRLPGFRTAAEPNVYQRLADGTAILDGYPIIWTDVLQPYTTSAAAGKPIVVFGELDFWWFGEHGNPRIDTSDQAFFQNDQLGVRFIEEIDFDYCASDATSALLTAAS